MSLYGCVVNLYGYMVIRLYGVSFKCDPYKRCVLIVCWFGKVCLSTGIHDATDTAAPVLQECGFK